MYSHFLYKLAFKLANQDNLIESELGENPTLEKVVSYLAENYRSRTHNTPKTFEYLESKFELIHLVKKVFERPEKDKYEFIIDALKYMADNKIQPKSHDSEFLKVLLESTSKLTLEHKTTFEKIINAFSNFTQSFSFGEIAYYLEQIVYDPFMQSLETLIGEINPSSKEVLDYLKRIKKESPHLNYLISVLIRFLKDHKHQELDSHNLGFLVSLSPQLAPELNSLNLDLGEFLAGLQIKSDKNSAYHTIKIVDLLTDEFELNLSIKKSEIQKLIRDLIQKTNQFIDLLSRTKDLSKPEVQEFMVLEILKDPRFEYAVKNRLKDKELPEDLKIIFKSLKEYLPPGKLSGAVERIYSIIEDFLTQNFNPEFEEEFWKQDLGLPPKYYGDDLELAEILNISGDTALEVLNKWENLTHIDEDVFNNAEDVADVFLDLLNHHPKERIRYKANEALRELIDLSEDPEKRAELGIIENLSGYKEHLLSRDELLDEESDFELDL